MFKIKFTIKNILYLIIYCIMYYFILFNIVLSIIFGITTLYVIDLYLVRKRKLEKRIYTEFQINSFIKNYSICSLTNNYNVLDSLKNSITYLDPTLKNNIEQCIAEIETDYNYEKALKKLGNKYMHNRVFQEFLNNLLIIKEQSNVESSAKQIYTQASLDSQRYIVHIDKINSLKKEHFKNYLANTFIGLFVIYLIVFALNTYYLAYANSIGGILLNSGAIIISLMVTIKLINKTFEVKNED